MNSLGYLSFSCAFLCRGKYILIWGDVCIYIQRRITPCPKLLVYLTLVNTHFTTNQYLCQSIKCDRPCGNQV